MHYFTLAMNTHLVLARPSDISTSESIPLLTITLAAGKQSGKSF